MAYPPADPPRSPSGAGEEPPRFIEHRPRRPLVTIVGIYLTGLVCGAFSLLPLSGVISLAVVTGGIAFLPIKPAVKTTLLYLSLLFAGWATMLFEVSTLASHDLRRLLARSQEHVEWTGRVVNHPQLVETDERGRKIWQFVCAVDSIRRASDHQPATGKLRVHLSLPPDSDLRIMYGDLWLMRGVVRLDQRSVVRAQGIVGYTRIHLEQARRLKASGGNPILAWCYRLREVAYDRLGWGLPLDSASAALTRALLLGYRQDVPYAVHEAFARTGTLHILALSGMHVGILILLLVVVMKSLGVNRPHWVLFFLPFLTAYTMATGAAASTVRASIMAITFFSAYLFRRRPDTLSSLALAAGFITVVDPLQLFHFGFILSFVVVGGLVVLYPPLIQILRPSVAKDGGLDPETSWLNAAHTWWQRLVDGFGISAAAWLASLPLIATVFHLISPIALLVNLLMAPLAFLILLTTCLSLGGGLFSFEIASIFNHANYVFAEILMGLVRATSKIPGGYTYVAAWPWFLMLAWYGCLMMWVAGTRSHRWIATIGLIAMIAYSMGQRSWSQKVEAVVIPVGDASVVLVDGPGRHTLLVDAGSAYHVRTLVDLMRSRGISALDQVIITRATSDAYGGLDGVLAAMRVGQLFLPDLVAGPSRYQERLQDWLTVMGQTNVVSTVNYVYSETSGGLVWRKLFPALGEPYKNARESASILRISRGDQSLIFMGQSGSQIETLAGHRPVDWSADILVAGKCDRLDSFSPLWLSLVEPEVLVVSLAAFDRLPRGPGPLMDRLALQPVLRVIALERGQPWTTTW